MRLGLGRLPLEAPRLVTEVLAPVLEELFDVRCLVRGIVQDGLGTVEGDLDRVAAGYLAMKRLTDAG